MISFDLPSARFSVRAVGIAVQEGRVLMHREEGGDFWSLPGGRCEIMEESAQALAREMREELGVVVAVERVEPEFLRAGLRRLPDGIEHIINRDEGAQGDGR